MENHKVEKIINEGEIERILKEEILCEFCPRYILVGEDKTCLAEEYLKYAETIKNFEIRNDDIWVASYPKTGTTWVQEMVWSIANNLNFEEAKEPLIVRFPFFEASTIQDVDKFVAATKITEDCFIKSVEFVKNKKSPRFIKTHLPFSLLPDQIVNQSKTPKVIYVTRNPKDTCVSYCHHGNLLQGWRTNVENFAKVFMADRALFGSFWKHVMGFWEKSHWPNLLIIKYEDMKKDLPTVIKKVAKFINRELTEGQIQALTEHLGFDSMKRRAERDEKGFLDILKKINMSSGKGSFFRSGTIGKYKEELSPEIIKQFDEWIKQNISGTNFEQYYDHSL